MPPPIRVEGVIGEASQAPMGGGLRVREVGFSPVPDGRDAAHQFVSVGALLENVSDRVAYRTGIRLRLRDAQGRDVTGSTGQTGWFEIPMIMPGQRIPFGQWRRLPAREGERAIRVLEVVVELGRTTWIAPLDELFKPMHASAMSVRTGDPAWIGTTIDYGTVSPYCWNLVHHGMAAVFRGPTGAIVGGSLMAIGECRSGVRRGSGSVIGVPYGVTVAGTELYPYCDVIGGSAAGTA